MFELSNEVQSKLKKQSKFGIKEEDLKYLVEVVKFLYKKEAKDENNNVIIDTNTGKPKLVDSLRRSGSPKYTHPNNVALYLYNKGYSREYIITALFHDVLEDTKYTEKNIRKILEKYLELYPNVVEGNKDEFLETIINAVNCVTKKGKISRPKAPDLELKKPIYINNIRIDKISYHEFAEKKQITRNFDGTLVRKSVKDLNISDLTEESQKELENYERELDVYEVKMLSYINEIKKSKIARIVKVADRISNLTDFSPTDNSNWLEKYIRETNEHFLNLAIGTDFGQDFIDAIKVATLTQNVKKENEHGDKGELII